MSSRGHVVDFGLWALAGALLALGLVTPFTLGPVLLPLGLAVGAATAVWRGAGPACVGLLAGAGVIPLFLAYLNRGGPGDVCTRTATSETCTQEWSPWPFLGVGVALVVAAVVLFRTQGTGRHEH